MRTGMNAQINVHTCTHLSETATYLPQSPEWYLNSSTSANCTITDMKDYPKQTFHDMCVLWLAN